MAGSVTGPLLIGCVLRIEGSFCKDADPYTSLELVNFYRSLAMSRDRFLHDTNSIIYSHGLK